MSLAFQNPTPEPAFDRVLVVGASASTIDLLRLATIRSDDVVVIADRLDAASRAYATRFAVEWIQRPANPADLADASSVVLAEEDVEAANVLVRAARRAGVPIHVSGRPLVSDFSLLEFLESRPSARAARGASARDGLPANTRPDTRRPR